MVAPKHKDATWSVQNNVLSAMPSSHWKSFINILAWLTGISTSAKSAQKMMRHPTETKILSASERMTGKDQKLQNALKQTRKSIEHGGQKIKEDKKHTHLYAKRYGTGSYLGAHVSVAERKNLLHIMRIMTNLWMLCGYVNHATNNDTKKSFH